MTGEHRRGQWDALDRILELISHEDRLIDRDLLYSEILKLRPIDDHLPLLCISCRSRDS